MIVGRTTARILGTLIHGLSDSPAGNARAVAEQQSDDQHASLRRGDRKGPRTERTQHESKAEIGQGKPQFEPPGIDKAEGFVGDALAVRSRTASRAAAAADPARVEQGQRAVRRLACNHEADSDKRDCHDAVGNSVEERLATSST